MDINLLSDEQAELSPVYMTFLGDFEAKRIGDLLTVTVDRQVIWRGKEQPENWRFRLNVIGTNAGAEIQIKHGGRLDEFGYQTVASLEVDLSHVQVAKKRLRDLYEGFNLIAATNPEE